jgi:6,7-dimethyl-8-ribityllumazine synthase
MKAKRFAIITSRFNPEITQGLLRGAKLFFTEHNVSHQDIDSFDAPGAFEIPLIAKTLAKTKKYAGVIGLGCVIKGDTAHFEFISLGASLGMMETMLETEVPVSFGILTTYTDEQALLRSRDNAENKGREAAAACFETANTLTQIRGLN